MSQIQIVQTGVGVPLMMIAAVLSDRWQRRKPFVSAGALLVMAGLIGLAISSNWTIVLVASTAIGIGFRFFYSLGQAMVTQILPAAASRGKDLGVLNIASTVPQIVLPGIGAALLNALGLGSPVGYAILFVLRRVIHCAGDHPGALYPRRPLRRFPYKPLPCYDPAPYIYQRSLSMSRLFLRTSFTPH